MSSPTPRRLRRGLLVAIAALLLVAGGAVAFLLIRQPGDVSNPDVAFTVTDTPEETQPPAQPRTPRRAAPVDTFLWPTYGLNEQRTRAWTNSPDYLSPRFRRGWTYRGRALLEFPPAI